MTFLRITTQRPQRYRPPQIDWAKGHEMSKEQRAKFNWGWGMTCIVILLLVFVMETYQRIARCKNNCTT